MTTPGMAFFRALWNRTGAGTGIDNSVGLGLAALGTTQSTALALTDDWNQIITAAAGSGVVLPALAGGQSIFIANEGLNPVAVYPPIGSAIDALSVNGAYSLTNGKLQLYSFFSSYQIYSLQLG
jgi:hypothetical protein